MRRTGSMSRTTAEAQAERLVSTYADMILRLSYTYLHTTADAEDICQTVLLRVMTGAPRFSDPEHERAWIIRTTINACKDLLKSAWARNTDRSVTPDALPEGSAGFDEQDDTVTRAVMSLPPKLKEVTLLRWYQGMSLEEISGVLRMPRSTVSYRLKKAKSMLKGKLEEWYDEE